MQSASTIWTPDAEFQADQEGRIDWAQLCGVVENLRRNMAAPPLLALAICVIFSQWVALPVLALCYAQLTAGYIPHALVLRRFPAGPVPSSRMRRWRASVAGANLFFIANWAATGWYLWVPGNLVSHILIELLLGAIMAVHATSTAACRAIARPALGVYLLAMALPPLQNPAWPNVWLSLTSTVYIAFVGLLGHRSYLRARAAILAQEERNTLLAQMVMAKLESDRSRDQAEAASLAK